jgi:hypothetical protein
MKVRSTEDIQKRLKLEKNAEEVEGEERRKIGSGTAAKKRRE